MGQRPSRSNLKPGDHIYTWRTAYIYAHHGIYVGDGAVIHFMRPGQEVGTGSVFKGSVSSRSQVPCPNCIPTHAAHGVVSSCLNCFLAGDNLYLYEYEVSFVRFITTREGTCVPTVPDPDEVVVHRAKYLLNNGFGSYDVLMNNCEHFAFYCKTGLIKTGLLEYQHSNI
ncbi:hypothetical protein ACS0TY_026372 [Phlomoides rotata]